MSYELQNAFALSQMEYRKQDDSRRIKVMTSLGFFVVTGDYLAHCNMTDAVLGCETFVDTICSNYEDAEKVYDKLQEEYRYESIGIACPQSWCDEQARIDEFEFLFSDDDDDNVPF